jgi:hypothetical protein
MHIKKFFLASGVHNCIDLNQLDTWAAAVFTSKAKMSTRGSHDAPAPWLDIAQIIRRIIYFPSRATSSFAL